MSNKVDPTIDYALTKREDAAKLVFKYFYPNYHKSTDEPIRRWEFACRLQDLGWSWEGGTWVPPASHGEWIAPGTDTKAEGPAPATEEVMEDRAKLAFHAAGMAWTDVFGPLVVRNKCAYSDYLASIGWTYNVYRGEWLPPDGDVKPAAAEQATQQDEPEVTRCAAIRALVNLGFSRADAEARISKEQTESKCKSCGGNNADMPCAYPEGGQPHCLKQAEFHAQHASDCAVHNEPAMSAGDCDCGTGGKKDMRYEAVHALREAGWVWTEDEKWQAPPEKPIDMVLFCPHCGTQHIDAPELGGVISTGWDNPPHRSHLCHKCHRIWRPADVATNGVADTKTHGKRDDPLTKAEWSGYERSRRAVEGIQAMGFEWNGYAWGRSKEQLPTAQTEVPTPKREATGAFYGLSDEQVADVVQELVDGVRRGEVKVESLCVRFDMDDRNKRVIHIEYTACKT
jgi:hypothetical protein